MCESDKQPTNRETQMPYKIVDVNGREHNVHTGKPLKSLANCQSNYVLAVQVEDNIELWELFDNDKNSILGVLHVAYADMDIEILGWSIMTIYAGISCDTPRIYRSKI